MCKNNEYRRTSVAKSFRVECNSGSKYFTCKDHATACFDYMAARGFDVEMWLVKLHYDEDGSLIRGEQILIAADADEEFLDSLN